MTKLNFTLIWCVGLASLLCYQRVEPTFYGRYFSQALETIHGQGLEPIGRQSLFDAAVEGMTSQLDPHSGFITRDQRVAYQSDLDQHFSGVGIEVRYDPETKRIIVMNTIIGLPHPAHDGLRRGDQIVAVDGVSVKGKPLDEAMSRIKGPVGQTVQVTVLREGQAKPIELSIVRKEIQVDSVVGDAARGDGTWRYTLDTQPTIAYVRIKSFGEGTSKQLYDVLTHLQEQGQLHALVVDVHDNPGGYLEEAVSICNLFITSGVIVSTRNRQDEWTGKQEIEIRHADGSAPFAAVPMAVLINGEGQASEIFAACMQDHGRAVVIGSRSYGKGSVQKMFPMEEGESILKLTTASYWRPSGKNIHRVKSAKETDEWGVRPDPGFDVPLTKDAEKARREAQSARDAFRPGAETEPAPPLDPQLAKAVEYLKAKLHN